MNLEPGTFNPSAMTRRCMDALRPVTNFLLPPVCLSCDSSVASQGGLCGECWSSLRHIDKPWCSVLGTPFTHDLGSAAISAPAIAEPPVFDRARSVVLYDDVARRLVRALKFSDRTDLAPWLAAAMVQFARRSEPSLIDDNPLVVPVPLHRRRLLSRRFNQSAELARAIARETGSPYVHMVLTRVRATRQQVGLGKKDRRKNVRGAFRVPLEMKARVDGAHILLIDDVFTTGATLDACARALKRAGARQIDCLTYARVAPGDL